VVPGDHKVEVKCFVHRSALALYLLEATMGYTTVGITIFKLYNEVLQTNDTPTIASGVTIKKCIRDIYDKRWNIPKSLLKNYFRVSILKIKILIIDDQIPSQGAFSLAKWILGFGLDGYTKIYSLLRQNLEATAVL